MANCQQGSGKITTIATEYAKFTAKFTKFLYIHQYQPTKNTLTKSKKWHSKVINWQQAIIQILLDNRRIQWRWFIRRLASFFLDTNNKYFSQLKNNPSLCFNVNVFIFTNTASKWNPYLGISKEENAERIKLCVTNRVWILNVFSIQLYDDSNTMQSPFPYSYFTMTFVIYNLNS